MSECQINITTLTHLISLNILDSYSFYTSIILVYHLFIFFWVVFAYEKLHWYRPYILFHSKKILVVDSHPTWRGQKTESALIAMSHIGEKQSKEQCLCPCLSSFIIHVHVFVLKWHSERYLTLKRQCGLFIYCLN